MAAADSVSDDLQLPQGLPQPGRQGTTIEKGTTILMSTHSGIGWAPTIKDGEEMKILFEGIGTLVNTFSRTRLPPTCKVCSYVSRSNAS
jgi:hypothetical protein